MMMTQHSYIFNHARFPCNHYWQDEYVLGNRNNIEDSLKNSYPPQLENLTKNSQTYILSGEKIHIHISKDTKINVNKAGGGMV